MASLLTRRLRTEYLSQLKLASRKDDYCCSQNSTNKTSGKASSFRTRFQDYIRALRMAGGVVNTTIVMAAANGIVKAKDISRLASHGGSITINKGWARSLLNRMKYVKRKCSNAGKVSMPDFEKIQEVFLVDITAEVLMNDIPNQLIINWDHTGLSLLPTGQWTMHCAGEKVVPIAHVDDKRRITAVLAANMTGELSVCMGH